MAKLTLNNITSGYASTAALNAAFDAIEVALENTLSRDGTGPNSMQADFDMNGYAILNQRATSGDANFLWKGAWATGTTYSANNLVYATEGTNLGNGLICVADHVAGATLDGDAAYWAVYVLKGASVGGIAGPVSSTIGYIPQWNDVGGTELKAGVPIGSSGGVQAYSANLATFATKTFIDEDTMVSNLDTAIPSQQSVKSYTDTKVSAVTGTAPVVSSGGTAPAISMAAATASVDGYMSSTYAGKLDGIAAGATVGVLVNAGVQGLGTMVLACASCASGLTVAGAALNVPRFDAYTPALAASFAMSTGTWKNISPWTATTSVSAIFQRIV